MLQIAIEEIKTFENEHNLEIPYKQIDVHNK